MTIIDYIKAYADISIFSILIIMSFIVLYKTIERILFYRKFNINTASNICDLEFKLISGLTPIYTVGAISPYIGLLGTILGIIITFYDLGSSQGELDTYAIMLNLGLALKATALGILVAIPAISFYNYLLNQVELKKLLWKAQNEKI